MPEDRILTNVRLTPAEHRAAKQRAAEWGVSLAEVLRRGLRGVLAEGGASVGAGESAGPYRAQPAPPGRGSRSPGSPGSPGSPDEEGERLAVLARTAGALRADQAWDAGAPTGGGPRATDGAPGGEAP